MEREELITHIKRIVKKVSNDASIVGVYTEACDLIRNNVGSNSSFYKSLEQANPINARRTYGGYTTVTEEIRSILQCFLDYAQAGLHQEISPERQAQLDVVSDFLEMADILLQTKGVHPAAPAVLIGATLEEFLRTWIEAESIPLGNRKAGLEAYSQILRESNLITKQDGKDITSWAGTRNHAAHGEWEDVGDKNKVALMLEGVISLCESTRGKPAV